MQTISASELKEKFEKGEQVLLIDVREPWEHELFNLGGKLMPMNTVLENKDNIPSAGLVVFYCQKGIRSGIVIQRLQQKNHHNNLLNLAGGVDAWVKQFGDAPLQQKHL